MSSLQQKKKHWEPGGESLLNPPCLEVLILLPGPLILSLSFISFFLFPPPPLFFLLFPLYYVPHFSKILLLLLPLSDHKHGSNTSTSPRLIMISLSLHLSLLQQVRPDVTFSIRSNGSIQLKLKNAAQADKVLWSTLSSSSRLSP